jgi:hypothetical protein
MAYLQGTDEQLERFHAMHEGLSPLENVGGCWDCDALILNHPEEYLPDDSPIFWAMFYQAPHDQLEPSEFDFVFQPQLVALGLIDPPKA